MELLRHLQFNDEGHIPAIIVSASSKQVLTLSYMTDEALRKTVETGKVHVFRRSLGRLMVKGETSGHIQIVKGIYPDCEGKSLVIEVEQKVAACHKGYMSCYYRQYDPEGDELKVIADTVFDPEKTYR